MVGVIAVIVLGQQRAQFLAARGQLGAVGAGLGGVAG